ncbi:NAD-dependent epimerase/dehydratase family protein [uncultured Metabacillus sp.]|uniref:NAD-dependent epimerase/dehydratase family protein n=1 Tax=uncultured Metabacillus sp. TaxID=2860135 RepID=UPI00261CB231|nr:NAD-dependent epimerase/dehydratase family protein [uncultured Metabacillus sp.]
MKQPAILITGASGFTGQHACSHFLKAGYHVIAVSRNGSFSNKKITVEHCDLTIKEDVIKLIKKIKPEYVLHLAGQNHVGKSWSDPISSMEANIMSTAYLLEALRQVNPACKIVVVGSALQFNPNNLSTLTHPYSLSKTLQILIAQSWAALYKMHIVIAKPSNLIGPGFSSGVCSIFAQRIVEMEENAGEKVLEVYNPYVQRDFIDVRDAVTAYEILLNKGSSGEIYDISSGKSRSLDEIIIGYKALTSVDFKVNTQVNNLLEQPVIISTQKLIELGWKQLIPIETSLRDILYFYRGSKNNP